MDDKAREKIQDLQVLEHNLQSLLMQKQNLNIELSETENAIFEINKTTDSIYKMIGSIIVSVDKAKTLEELEEKKKLIGLRNSSVEKQEKSISLRATDLQNEIKKLLENSSSASK